MGEFARCLSPCSAASSSYAPPRRSINLSDPSLVASSIEIRVADHSMLLVPSQTLPDHQQDPLKFPTRSVSRLDEEVEHESVWDQTFRPPTFDPTTLRHPAHSRDSSAEKIPQLPPSLASPRTHGPLSRSTLGGVVERPLDSGKSSTYGHHRQTSIVHGIQHSRNGSLASSSSSPLSPQMIAAAGISFDRSDMQSVAARLDTDTRHTTRAPTALAGSMANSNSRGNATERSISSSADTTSQGSTQRKLERMHSKSGRDHPVHHSLSSRLRDDQKTVGEYALHVLFTSVCHQF